jgi:hypothetical protein
VASCCAGLVRALRAASEPLMKRLLLRRTLPVSPDSLQFRIDAPARASRRAGSFGVAAASNAPDDGETVRNLFATKRLDARKIEDHFEKVEIEDVVMQASVGEIVQRPRPEFLGVA